MDETLTTPTLPVEVRYITANERLIERLRALLDKLTRDGKPFIITLAFNGRTIDIWQGHKAGRTFV